MPTRRSTFWIVLAIIGPGSGLLCGCDQPRAALLAARPDIDLSGAANDSASAGTAIDCVAGQPWVARVEQRDFDAGLELLDAGGRPLAAVAGPAGAAGREYLYWEPAQREALRLRIVAARPATATAYYHLQVFCLPRRPSTDVRRAFSAMNSAASPARPVDPRRRDAAVAQYSDAEAIWTRLGESRLAADVALQLAALQYYERQDWPPALAAARRVLRSADAMADIRLRADALQIEGAAALELARGGLTADAGAGARPALRDPWAAALAALSEAQSLYRRAAAPVSAARVQIYIAGMEYDRGDFDAAVAGYEAAGAALRALAATEDEARVARNLAAVRLDRGDYDGAALAYERILAQMPLTPSVGRGSALQNLAAAYSATGDAERALGAYRESLDIGKKLGDDDLLARAFAGLGVNHGRLGHGDLAVTYLREAVAMRRREGHAEVLAQTLAQLGNVYLQQRDLARAIAAHREAVASIGSNAAPLLRARMLLALGMDEAATGRNARAIHTYSSALALLWPLSNGLVARTLVARATSQRLTGALGAAQADAERAAVLSRTNDDRETLIGALIENARVAIARGDSLAALRAATSAVGEIERLPAGAANPDNRITLRARLRDAYELRVQLLAQDALRARGRGELALARAQSLAALRATIGIDLPLPIAAPGERQPRGAIDPLDETYTLLAARRYRLATLAERHAQPTPTMRALEQEIALLRTRLASGIAAGGAGTSAIRVSEPPRQPASLHTVQVPIALPADMVVITYSLGATHSWAWALTRDRIDLYALPPRADIDAGVARLLQDIRSLATGSGAVGPALGALERLVLPAAITAGKARRWRIVPDGSLGAVPWPLLATRHSIGSASLLPSAATLFAPTAKTTHNATSPALRVALFGDPVFGAGDERLAALPNTEARPARAVTGDPAADLRELPRLPGTSRELAAIAQRVTGGVVVQATGLDATRAALLQLPAGRVDVLHLATHATIDADVPELAAIVLSRIDAAGRSQPGDVRAHDILGMRGVPALVVLSACDAAAEPAGAADGRMNLVRAFLAAGAHDVVASLWETGDASTVELMTHFYEELMQRGLEPEAALAGAQARLASAGRWRAPFYWAGFVVTRAVP